MITIYHNPRCSKSREGLQLLEDSGRDFTVVKYLDKPLGRNEITVLIKKLGTGPLGLVRQKEKAWVENYKGKQLTDSDIINALVKYPVLIERPIIVKGDKAVIGRPAENIKTIL